MPPARGPCPPWPPFLPTLMGLGFVRVLGPTRGGVANVGNSPHLFILRAHPPKPLEGGGPLCTRFNHGRRRGACGQRGYFHEFDFWRIVWYITLRHHCNVAVF
jgi:hypothetical protein